MGLLGKSGKRNQNADVAFNLPVMTHIPINGFPKFR
jgi:hypothetical protein